MTLHDETEDLDDRIATLVSAFNDIHVDDTLPTSTFGIQERLRQIEHLRDTVDTIATQIDVLRDAFQREIRLSLVHPPSRHSPRQSPSIHIILAHNTIRAKLTFRHEFDQPFDVLFSRIDLIFLIDRPTYFLHFHHQNGVQNVNLRFEVRPHDTMTSLGLSHNATLVVHEELMNSDTPTNNDSDDDDSDNHLAGIRRNMLSTLEDELNPRLGYLAITDAYDDEDIYNN